MTPAFLPHLPAGHRLWPVIRARRGSRVGGPPPWWDAAFFGCDGSAWREADPGAKQRVLEGCSRALVEEAWQIERLGLLYTSRMAMHAATAEERELYAHFAGDEARHQAALQSFVDGESSASSFHGWLADVITDAPAPIAVVLVQVVLEGWGLQHYRSMADATLCAPLAAALRAILVDEAVHHGTGRLLAVERPLDVDEGAQAAAWLAPVLEAVRSGPQTVLGLLRDEGLPADLVDVDAHVRSRLTLLRDLVSVEPTLAAALADAWEEP